MKEQAGVSSRCMPLKQSGTTGKCVCCGKSALLIFIGALPIKYQLSIE